MLWGGEEIAMVGKKQSSGRSEPRAEAETASGRRRRPKRGARGPKEATPARIQSWVDDPASPWGLMERPAPVLDARPWAFSISGEAIPVGVYEPGTAGFRHWTAADSLRRTADLWAPLLGRHRVKRWQPAETLPVTLDAGSDLNAYYDRTQLAFFHSGRGKAAVYSGESPDIVCHETGHACLDALRPDLWDAPFIEIAAFHEAFGDITAMLAALALPQVREQALPALVASKASPLSRIAEQLGGAMRQSNPAAVESDCLRNASNHWKYVAPESLPASAPATELSAEPHAFSRVFTGAFHDLLSRMLRDTGPSPSADDLAAVAAAAARLVIDAVAAAPVQPDFFAQVGARLIDVDAAVFAGRYGAVITDVLVGRRILTAATAPGDRSDAATGKRAATARGGGGGRRWPATDARDQRRPLWPFDRRDSRRCPQSVRGRVSFWPAGCVRHRSDRRHGAFGRSLHRGAVRESADRIAGPDPCQGHRRQRPRGRWSGDACPFPHRRTSAAVPIAV